jgi:ABC-type Co2+ transport system permease subunit
MVGIEIVFFFIPKFWSLEVHQILLRLLEGNLTTIVADYLEIFLILLCPNFVVAY